MIDPARWYPVAASDDLPQGHVYQTMLGGNPLAIWRASDGTVNIWEDRCPHRGVRFSIGIVQDDELRCQYHAWRFASGSGACTHIPAQPTAKPAAAIRATVWPVVERDGLVWTGVAPVGDPLSLGDGVVLRAIPVNRDAATAEAALFQDPPRNGEGDRPKGGGGGVRLGESRAERPLHHAAHGHPPLAGEDEWAPRFVVQPVDAGRCVIRGVAPVEMLHQIDAALEALRRSMESVPC
jgi:nitrite reductase/ring-hydroxylating ferredoxin subunit